MRVTAGAASLVLFALGGCSSRLAPPPVDENLVGLRAPYVGPSLLPVIAGSVGRTAALVSFDVASPLTLVSAACFPSGVPASAGTVRVPRPDGRFEVLREVLLEGARVASSRLRARPVGLRPGEDCRLVLGTDVLAPYALSLDPVRREVTLSPSGRRLEGMRALPLTREPRTDWPLLPVRLSSGEASWTGPVVLSTASKTTTLEGGVLPSVQVLDTVELAPGLGVAEVRPERAAEWAQQGVFGELGADVWGALHVIVDSRARTLYAQQIRPLVLPQRTGEDTPTEPEPDEVPALP